MKTGEAVLEMRHIEAGILRKNGKSGAKSNWRGKVAAFLL
jgi:hypothetical protein